MKSILFTSPGIAELVDEETPQVSDGKVKVELIYSSVSAGTERANLIGDPNVSVVGTDRTVRFPRRSGYSCTGRVTEIGAGVSDIKVGDRVACSWSQHSEYVLIDQSCVYPLDDSVSDSAGALVHIATFPMAAIRKCRLEIGESAAVVGLGILGLVAITLLRAAGAVPIIAVDPIESKRKRALELGADVALDPTDKSFAKEVKRITHGGVNVAIEVTGKGAGLNTALDCMAKFGRVALLGCTRSSDFSIDYYRKVHGPGISLIGAHTLARPALESSPGLWTERDDALAVIRLLKHGRLDLDSLVEEIHSPTEAPQMYTRLANEPCFPVVQFDWRRIK